MFCNFFDDNNRMEPSEFWATVKELIKTQNTTQDWLASNIGVSVGTLKNWIYYDRIPDGYQTYLIAKALNTTVDYLMTGETPSNAEQIAHIKRMLREVNEAVDGIK